MTITIEQADTYHGARANEAWFQLSEEEKSAALVRAADYIEAFYTLRSDVQEDHPRLVSAVCALALELHINPQGLQATVGIKTKKESFEGLDSTEITYQDAPTDPYPQITGLLSPITVRPGGSGIQILRLVR